MKFRFFRSLKVFFVVVSSLIICYTLKSKKTNLWQSNTSKLISEDEKKDWHDWKFIEYEKSREGPGEQGKSYVLTDPKEIELNEKLFKVEGLYVVVSDKISVNRSIPDYRPEK